MAISSSIAGAVTLVWTMSVPLAPTLAAAADDGNIWHVGLCHVGLDHVPPSVPALHHALNEMGYKDGKSLRFDWRNQADEAAAEATMKEWVAAGVDVIVAFEDQCVHAARAATSQIPIVFLHAFDPLVAGYVESLARPGANLTGPVTMLDVIAKRLEFMKELGFRRVLLLVDPTDPFTTRELKTARNAAAALGLELVERDATAAADVERVFDALGTGEVDAVLPASPVFFTKIPALILELAERADLPLTMHHRAWVERGALFAYGTDFPAAGRAAARYVDRIIKGANPAELPVEELSELVLTLNLKRAEELGLSIPPAVLLRADEVIE